MNQAVVKSEQPTDQPTITVVKKALPKIRSICVDTITTIMKNDIHSNWGSGKMIPQIKWRDMGVELVRFAGTLKDMGFTLVGVVGPPGTGKTFGMKHLHTKTNIWYNCDSKPSTYKGGRQEYGTPQQPTYIHKVPKTYQEILDSIYKVNRTNMFDANPVAFLIGHTEDYKSGDSYRQRLKTMGNIAKASLEDMLTMCYYTECVPNGISVDYKLRTQNSGTNSGRTMEGQHADLLIDNNYQQIIDSIDAY